MPVGAKSIAFPPCGVHFEQTASCIGMLHSEQRLNVYRHVYRREELPMLYWPYWPRELHSLHICTAKAFYWLPWN